MSIFEIKGGRITHRYLERKTKFELARMYMDLLCEVEKADAKIDELEKKLAAESGA